MQTHTHTHTHTRCTCHQSQCGRPWQHTGLQTIELTSQTEGLIAGKRTTKTESNSGGISLFLSIQASFNISLKWWKQFARESSTHQNSRNQKQNNKFKQTKHLQHFEKTDITLKVQGNNFIFSVVTVTKIQHDAISNQFFWLQIYMLIVFSLIGCFWKPWDVACFCCFF